MRVLHFLDRWKKQETDEEEENKSLRRRSNRNSFLDNLELMMEIMMAAIKQLWIETLVWMCFSISHSSKLKKMKKQFEVGTAKKIWRT